jgi:hypothetical protein
VLLNVKGVVVCAETMFPTTRRKKKKKKKSEDFFEFIASIFRVRFLFMLNKLIILVV